MEGNKLVLISGFLHMLKERDAINFRDLDVAELIRGAVRRNDIEITREDVADARFLLTPDVDYAEQEWELYKILEI